MTDNNLQDKDAFDHVRIELNGHGYGNVWINGQPLKSSIETVIVKTHASMPPEVTIRLYALVNGEVDAIVKTVANEAAS